MRRTQRKTLEQGRNQQQTLFTHGTGLEWKPGYTLVRGKAPGGGGGVLPCMGYIRMCGPKGYGFSAVLVINRVSILADFGHFGRK